MNGEYRMALGAIIAELDHVPLAAGEGDPSVRMRVRNAKRIARIAIGLETCSRCEQDKATAEGRAVKASIVFHTCGRDNP